MKLKQYYLGCLAHASYLIADEKTGIAAVVDPQRDIDQYLRDAQEQSWQIKYVFLTHFHADFLAGHIELRDRAGARIYLGGHAQAEYDFTPLKEGDTIEFGTVRIKALETPGHTPESMSLLVFDLAKSNTKPQAVLTGDTLFIGDVGRPDLLASIGFTSQELASMLYDSLHQKLMPLPDDTLVYPAHGAGSMCGKKLSQETVSTIGEQKRFNYALQPMGKEEFIKMVTGDQPEVPSYFVHDAILNRQERATLEKTLKSSLKPLELDAVLRLQNAGAQVLDVREPVDYQGAHLRDTINIALSGKFATWAGTLLDRGKPIVVIAENAKEEEAVMRLGRIGFDNVAGFLKGGMQALEVRPDLEKQTERITAVALAELLNEPEPPVVLDVRTEKEWQQEHIPGSLNIPLNHLRDRFAEIPEDRPLVVHCQSGYRSAIAASFLEQHGRRQMMDLVGGFKAWTTSKLPVIKETATIV